MAVSKRLRYEVLRRDNFACRYCGATAPEAVLVIDAVVPEALGGSHKDPANLVAACDSCNSGKSATPPGAEVVADVAQDALRWSRAMATAAAMMLARDQEVTAAHERFAEVWDTWTYGDDKLAVPKDPGWRESVNSLLAAGLPMAILEECVEIAMHRKRVAPENTFRYMCGVAWKKVGELQKMARGIANPEGRGEEVGVTPDRHQEGRADFASHILRMIPADDRDAAMEAVDDRDYCREHGEHVQTDDELLADAAEYVFAAFRDQVEHLSDCVYKLLLAFPDDIARDAMRRARTELYEYMGTDFDKPTFLTNALRHVETDLRYPQARAHLDALPPEVRAAWLAYAQVLLPRLSPADRELAVTAARCARRKHLPPGYGLCTCRGSVIPRCANKGTYHVLFEEVDCCAQGRTSDHKGHLVCEEHLEQLVGGTYANSAGQKFPIADYVAVPDDAWTDF